MIPSMTGESLPSLSEREFELFRRLLYDSIGLHLPPPKKALVRGRLRKRLLHYQMGSYEEYYEFVLSPSGREEREVMVDLLTTHETNFFREPDHFTYLTEAILKPRLNSAERHRTYRIWSAAVSSGEEAYTLAMVVHDTLREAPWEIFGTDVSVQAVETARQALYPLPRSREIPPVYLQRYCLKGVRSMEGSFLISDRLRNRVHFQVENLLEGTSLPGNFHSIFLRNVMIYFDFKVKREVVDRIRQRMEPGGYLFVGHSESLNNLSKDLKGIRQGIYQKQ